MYHFYLYKDLKSRRIQFIVAIRFDIFRDKIPIFFIMIILNRLFKEFLFIFCFQLFSSVSVMCTASAMWVNRIQSLRCVRPQSGESAVIGCPWCFWHDLGSRWFWPEWCSLFCLGSGRSSISSLCTSWSSSLRNTYAVIRIQFLLVRVVGLGGGLFVSGMLEGSVPPSPFHPG